MIKPLHHLAVYLPLVLCSTPSLANCPDPTRPAAPQLAFGPEQTPETLIVETIASARHSLRLAAFGFSSQAVSQALANAAKRGVDVQVVVDFKHNIEEDSKRISRRALDSLHAAGVRVRTNGAYRIHHDKFIIVDSCHVQTGSWNYTESAKRNSENVLILWNQPNTAKAYLGHWQSRFNQGTPYP